MKLILFTALVLTACGSSESSNSPAQPVESASPQTDVWLEGDYTADLQGEFRMPCQSFKRITLNNTTRVSVMLLEEFIDEKCETLKLSTRFTRKFAVISKFTQSQTGNNFYKIDITYESAETTVHVLDYSTKSLFGREWAVNVPQSVIGEKNDTITVPTKEQTFYHHVLITQKGALYMERLPWDDEAGKTSETRSPDAIMIPMEKQA